MSPGFKSEKETKLASAHLLSLAKDVVGQQFRVGAKGQKIVAVNLHPFVLARGSQGGCGHT